MSVMGNAYPASNRRPGSGSSSVHDNGDGGVDSDLVLLLEENARLRALVVQLSDIVLRKVVDQT